MLLPRFVLPLLMAVVLPAAATPANWRHDGGAAFDELMGRQNASFETIEARYADARKLAPNDMALAMAHCDFYWQVWDIEGLEWAEVAPDRHEDCLAGLNTAWPDAPEIRLFTVEQRWGEDSDKVAIALWDDAEDWPAPLRTRLALRLAEADDMPGFESGRFAVEAVKLGSARMLPKALRHLDRTKGAPAAVSLAASAPLAESADELNERLRALLTLDDKAAARDHLQRHRTTKIRASAELGARSLLQAGDLAGAERELALMKGPSDRQRSLRLDIALARGDAAAAAGLFEFDADEFAASTETYLRILSVSPLSAFRLTLLPSTVVILLTTFVLALLPLCFLVPVHYRGLMRRVAGKASTPVLPYIGIRHAWYASAVALVLAPLIAIGIFAPDAISEIIDDEVVQSPHLFSMMYWSTLASLLAMLPLLYWMRARQWLGPRSDLKELLPLVFGCYVAAFVVGMLTAAATALMKEAGIETSTSSFAPTLLQQGFAQFGMLTTLLLVAVLVPVFEEWLFRGVLLTAFSRHLSFGWANVLQAVLFTLVHDDLSKFPFYFTLGLLAGWLVRRYRYLLPAILLHMLNNGVAILLSAG